MNKKGFTLVELAIVIVVIGLLVGGILQGQALIEKSRLQNLIKNFTNVQAGYHSFVGQYDQIPGDSSTASEYFGTPCENLIPDAPTVPRCDGNGNKVIEIGEHMRFWPHLMLAGVYINQRPFLEHSGAVGGYDHSSLVSNYDNANIIPGARGIYGEWYPSAALPNTNLLYFTRHIPFVTMAGSVISPKSAWALDLKMDDGKPSLGKVQSSLGTYDAIGTCLTGTEYTVSNNQKACQMALAIFD